MLWLKNLVYMIMRIVVNHLYHFMQLEMMATLPKYMRKMAIDAYNAEALVSAVEKRTGRIEKAP